ncbi:hypothetical protein DSO57_1009392 [Entomophthora muscae]|uniref:Uncharacterized protein n=1 Tax=Entomophthora muscae TaxID=34485 RepID=A0ACC2T6P8_9FUNG|nr:hypothetical protein DSO57_1009392 [Entomophthora muscae]
MYSSLPHDEIDLYITSTGFFLTPTSEEERFPKETYTNNFLFQKNLAEASSIIHKEESDEYSEPENPSSQPQTDSPPQTSKTPRKIKIGEGCIHLSPPAHLVPALSQEQQHSSEGEFHPTRDYRAPPNHSSASNSSNSKHLRILFDRSSPVTEIDNFSPAEPFRRYRIFGIIGSLRLLTGWHLIVIRRQRQVAQIKGQAIFQITSIQLLPYDYTLSVLALEEESRGEPLELTQLSDSTQSVATQINLFERLKAAVQKPSSNETSFYSTPERGSNDLIEQGLTSNDSSEIPSIEQSPSFSRTLVDEIAQSTPLTGNTSLHSSSIGDESPHLLEDNPSKPAPRKASKSQDELLEARIKREIHRLFGEEGNMYVSYTYDLTRSLQRQAAQDSTRQPLWQMAHQPFWWNKSLQSDYITAELHNWILPVVQGFAQTELCEMDGFPFSVTLISRRDTRRLGMRYQRRGVNDAGHVANFVETEQILELQREGEECHVCSFVQVRGSIPLFWSQSPYSLKPVPIIERSSGENLDAIIKHLASLRASYGNLMYIVSLTELGGRESIVGTAYSNYTGSALSKSQGALGEVTFIEYDFHKETHGAKGFDLTGLTDKLEDSFSEVGYFWAAGETLAAQKGVFRTNCMDCLDRTNVVQSAFAQRTLNLQLFRLGIQEHPDQGLAYHAALEMTIGALWANNGDALSRAYAGTGALKADLTRTGRRNLQGMVSDATNSLARFYLNAFKDFFTQAVLDYLQGHHRLEKFREVAETHIATEPGLETRLLRTRLNAVQVSADLVLNEGETLAGGWVMLSPVRLGKLYHSKLEEKVVLLTSKSLYLCSFHFELEKVLGFTCIPLDRITSLQIGTYLLTPSDLRDAESPPDGHPPTSLPVCHGLVVHYRWDVTIERCNTRSLKSRRPTRLMQLISGSPDVGCDANLHSTFEDSKLTKSKPISRFVALKGLANLHFRAKLEPSAISESASPSDWNSHSIIESSEPEALDQAILTHTFSPDQVVGQLVDSLKQSYAARMAHIKGSDEFKPLPAVEKTIQR